MTTQAKKSVPAVTTKAPAKHKAKAPRKSMAVKNAASKPLVQTKPKAETQTPATVTGAKLKLVTPKKNWKIAFREHSVNGRIS